MEKRVLLAIVLSFAVLGFYPVLLSKFYPGYNKPSARVAAPPAASSGPVKPALPADSGNVLSEDKDTAFQTNKLDLLFNAEGGAIREVAFPAYVDSETGKPLKFLSLDRPGGPSEIRFLSAAAASDPALSGYKIERRGDEIVATAAGKALRVTKRFRADEAGYGGAMSLTFENLSGAPFELRYQLLVGSRIPARQAIDSQYIEANFYSGPAEKKAVSHIRESKRGKTVQSPSAVDWVAVKDRHFSIIIQPRLDLAFTGLVEGLGDNAFSASLVSPAVLLPAGGSAEHPFVTYFGPNELKALAPLGLDPLVNFGKLDWIGKLLLGALELLQKIFRNYGLAIIALTVLINVLLFPLTRVSYMSMKRMQLIQPQINKLREQNKKNPEKLNREMMELYKKHKVNPFGGCLPMVLQMPVFIALYVALSKAVALRNSGLLWVNDLSSPDSVPLPFSLPLLGNEVHVLPLIMVGAMVLQQKFTQIKMEGQDPAMASQQKMMAIMMPIVFGFMFYTMPSGLVLYWLTNTILMSLYQWRLKKVTLA
ncbi:MAG: membrane protein insertase YidC [Candidatus Omnitrophota bacterium]